MKILDKSEEGSIIKLTEAEIYTLTMALHTHGERVVMHTEQCHTMIKKLDKAVYNGETIKSRSG